MSPRSISSHTSIWDETRTPDEKNIHGVGIITSPVIDKTAFSDDFHFIVEKMTFSDSSTKQYALCLDLGIAGTGKTTKEAIEQMFHAITMLMKNTRKNERKQLIKNEELTIFLGEYWKIYHKLLERNMKKHSPKSKIQEPKSTKPTEYFYKPQLQQTA